MGVGFTIMMAGLMQGSQIDFLRQLVDTMPHITVQDERRSVPTQPAEQEYGAVQMSDIANVGRRPGIKYPEIGDELAARPGFRATWRPRSGPPRSSIMAARASASR